MRCVHVCSCVHVCFGFSRSGKNTLFREIIAHTHLHVFCVFCSLVGLCSVDVRDDLLIQMCPFMRAHMCDID